jgi:hypothetical protein
MAGEVTMTDEATYACTAQERHALDCIKAWPGIPATVIAKADGTWSVCTDPAVQKEYYRQLNAKDAM